MNTTGDNPNGNRPHVEHGAPESPIILSERERELILAMRLLQSQRKYCKLIAEFENGIMRFGVWQPQVKWK